MSTPLRRQVASVLFDQPRKGWVALRIDVHYAPVAYVPVPQRPYAYADDVVLNVPRGRVYRPWGSKHVARPIAHFGRWGVYASTAPGQLLVIAQDHETLINAVLTAKERNYARF
jgi:hypothetical protein